MFVVGSLMGSDIAPDSGVQAAKSRGTRVGSRKSIQNEGLND